MSRNLRLSKDREDELLRYCEEKWLDTQSDWAGWLDNGPRWTNAYRGFVKAKTDPWPGCSNLNIPITAIAVERMHSTLLSVLDDREKLFTVNPTDYQDIRQAKSIAKYMNHSFYHEMKLPPAFDRLAHKTCRNGMAAGVVRWVRDLRKTRECWTVMEGELGRKKDAREVAAYFYRNNLIEAVSEGKDLADVRYYDQEAMKERSATIRILRGEDGREDPRDGEIEFEVKATVLLRDCPVLDVPAVGDVLFTPDGLTPYDASCHFYSLWQTIDEIQAHRRSGYYRIDDELMEKLMKQWKGDSTADETALGQQSRANDEAYSTVSIQSAMRRDRFHVLKCFIKWDLDDDDEPVETIVTILRDGGGNQHLLRLEYLESVFPHRKRPFVFFQFIYLDDIPVAIGIPEYLSSIQAEVNTLFNQMNDANSIRNNPWFGYDPGSSLVPSSIRVRPGQGVPVAPGSLTFPAFNSNSVSDVQTLGMLFEFGEKMVPHGDPVMGRGSGGNRTAGGMAMLMQQAQTIWDKYIQRFGASIEEVAEQAIGLTAAYMPPWKEVRIAGTGEIVKIERAALRGGYDFTVRASMLKANKEIQRAYALQRYQLLQANPLYQPEEKQYILVRDLLESQEAPNIPEHLGPEPLQMRHTYLAPEQENAGFMQGIPWDPHSDEDHEWHLQAHQAFLMSPAASYGQAQQLAFAHVQMHQRFMAQAQRQAQQQAMGIPMDGSTPGADMGQAGGMNPLMNSVQQQPGAMMAADQMGVE